MNEILYRLTGKEGKKGKKMVEERVVFDDNLFMGPGVLYLILAVMNLKKNVKIKIQQMNRAMCAISFFLHLTKHCLHRLRLLV